MTNDFRVLSELEKGLAIGFSVIPGLFFAWIISFSIWDWIIGKVAVAVGGSAVSINEKYRTYNVHISELYRRMEQAEKVLHIKDKEA